MKFANVRELKNKTSEILKLAEKHGHIVADEIPQLVDESHRVNWKTGLADTLDLGRQQSILDLQNQRVGGRIIGTRGQLLGQRIEVGGHVAHELQGRLKMQIEEKRKSRAGLVAVRVHSSGDFFSQDYVDMWAELAGAVPEVPFYAYTKADKVLDFSKLDAVKNFNVIRSFIGGRLRNYGPPEYVKKVKAQYPDAFICPATHNKDVHCGGECNYCITGDKPLFFIHGSMKKMDPVEFPNQPGLVLLTPFL